MSERARGLARAVLGLLICHRVAYHLLYVAVVPFARATFSDGSLYESAARDLLRHPPWGSEPFYLQGAYAYLLALGMAGTGELLHGLMAQLCLAGLSLLAACWAFRRVFAADAGLLAMLCLLGYFPLAFYENKYLSASLGTSSLMLVWAALAWYGSVEQAPRRRLASFALGVCTALAVLARPNMLLAVPSTALALGLLAGRRRLLDLAPWALGLALCFAPMMLRNALVTGAASLFPAHGGGTSFYIGNNPHADGRWNSAGGLFSGQVGLERTELLRALELPSRGARLDAEAIGSELYRRAFAFIRSEPHAWLELEARKVWLTLGSDELTQDYDRLGERELLGAGFGWGIPFALLLALGFVGLTRLHARRREPLHAAWLALLGGQLLAALLANVGFFASSQHRLPISVVACPLAGLGLHAIVQRFLPRPDEQRASPAGSYVLIVAGLLCVQAWVPRESRSRPSIAHYYNLSVVEAHSGNVASAALALDRALARRPSDPVFLVEQAGLMRQLGQFAIAEALLGKLRGLSSVPAWVRERERIERLLSAQRRTESLEQLREGKPSRVW